VPVDENRFERLGAYVDGFGVGGADGRVVLRGDEGVGRVNTRGDDNVVFFVDGIEGVHAWAAGGRDIGCLIDGVLLTAVLLLGVGLVHLTMAVFGSRLIVGGLDTGCLFAGGLTLLLWLLLDKL
jgi:hypothetical protein